MLALVVRAGVLFAAVVVPILIRVAIFVEHDRWSPAAGSADGKVAIVTGANSGLGLETARVLAAAGATVVAACRSAVKCKEAIADIRQSAPAANLIAMELDLANADSVRRFAAEFLASHDQLHLLINNAAIMATPYDTAEWSGVTVERQFATNHLGPFLLTGLLQKVLEATPGARVINHSSSASDGCQRVKNVHDIAQVPKSSYSAFLDSYACSKRANRYFTWSLNQRLSGVVAIACHPGWTGTNLQHRATGLMGNMPSWFVAALTAALNAAYSQPPSLGAQPQLYAALHPTATVNASDGLRGGELVGPRFVLFGSPVLETTDFCQLSPRHMGLGYCTQESALQAWAYTRRGCGRNGLLASPAEEDIDALWAASEKLTRIVYTRNAS